MRQRKALRRPAALGLQLPASDGQTVQVDSREQQYGRSGSFFTSEIQTLQLMPSHFKSHRILLKVALLLFKLLPTQHALQLSKHRLLPVSYNTSLQCEWRARHSRMGEGSAQATPGIKPQHTLCDERLRLIYLLTRGRQPAADCLQSEKGAPI